MAAGTNTGGQAKSCRFLFVLWSAVSEWSLIIILLVNAVLAYVATRIARFCMLPAPCLLCSRLDPILGNERREFYRNLFCHEHKVDISSLVYCHGHRKLADFREMCEACLLSSAATVRMPKTIFGVNLEDGYESNSKIRGEDLDDAPPLKEDLEPGSLGAGLCSCCSEPFSLRRKLQAKKKKKKIGGGLPGRRVQLRKRQDKSLDPTAVDCDLLSHVGYSELKITSDSESAERFSDDEDDNDDDGHGLVRVAKDIKEESVMRRRLRPGMANINQGLATTALEDMVPERLIHPNPVVPQNKPLNEGDSRDKSSLMSRVGHGLEEANWSSADVKANPVESSSPEQLPREVATTETLIYTERGVVDCVPGKLSSSTGITTQVGPIDRNDSLKNAFAKKGIMLSPRFSEIVAGKAQEDLKLRLSQKSYRVLDLPWSDITTSPRVQLQGEDLKSSDVSGSIGLQNIAKRLYVERNNSSLESFDVNLLGDIEGETSVDRLKQQIELDRKSLSALYKELEEERNASAVAANEAMAMINRLQEEKAAMQMEALQYLRMMEEQSEYDQEAIQKLNDLLTEREKELLDLEAEIESYRKRLGEALEEKVSWAESRELASATSTPRPIRSLARSKSEKTDSLPQEYTEYGVKDLLLGFEEEKAHIATCLKRLQKKFHLLSTGKASWDETAAEPDRAIGNGEYGGHDGNSSENGSSPSSDRKMPSENGNSDISHLQDEVSEMNERLRELDEDREFLGHAISALRYGSDGVRLVKEIAGHLKELRRIPIAEEGMAA
ncbi:myosin-binding protein 1-like [Musa acuminata AAA Group]|uniref:myosin-binding protein 1-like n=1 Tax=Musa acuminata AAA Group TaxID=214697 RepID=UPI0031D78835